MGAFPDDASSLASSNGCALEVHLEKKESKSFSVETWKTFLENISPGGGKNDGSESPTIEIPDDSDYYEVVNNWYTPKACDTRVSLIQAHSNRTNLLVGWRYLVGQGVKRYPIEGEHLGLLDDENSRAAIKAIIDEVLD